MPVIQVSAETKTALMKLKGKMIAESGETQTFDDVIKAFLVQEPKKEKK